jgi:hypothetical protein
MKAAINITQEEMKDIIKAIWLAQTKSEETTRKQAEALHVVLSSEKLGKEKLCKEFDKEIQWTRPDRHTTKMLTEATWQELGMELANRSPSRAWRWREHSDRCKCSKFIKL